MKNFGRDNDCRHPAEAMERRVLLASIAGAVFDDPNLNGRLDAGEGASELTQQLVVYLDANGNGTLERENHSFGQFGAQDVPDGGTLRSAATVSGVDSAEGVIGRFAVLMDLRHTRQSDVTATLVSPSGRRVVLFSGVGGDGDDFNYIFLHDGADKSVTDGTANFSGEYRPIEPLTPLLDEPLDGEWALEISDGATGETGQLLDWSVNFLVGERVALIDGQGQYAFADLPAGSYTARLNVAQGAAKTLPAADGGRALTLGADDAATGVDFAAASVGQNVVTGTVYDDANANGAFDAGESPLPGRRVLADSNGNGIYDPHLETRTATDVPQPLSAEETYSRITVNDLPGNPSWVSVWVDVQHVAPVEIDLTLIAPDGLRVPLGHRESSFENRTFDHDLFLTGQSMNGTWTLEVEDENGRFRGTIRGFSITFTVGPREFFITTDENGQYRFEQIFGAFNVILLPGERPTEPAGGGVIDLEPLFEDQSFVRNFGVATGAPPASVVGRRVFYDGSSFDASPAGNDAAVATDKGALLPGQGAATFANVSSYVRGLNGLMIDIEDLPAGTELSAADFDFRTGNSNDLGTWADLAAEPVVSVRRGAGQGGSDRVTLAWPQGAARNAWLEVSVLVNERTGLASPDVFYFGHLAGEVGNNAAGGATVTAADMVAARPRLGAAAITDRRDFNRDGRVNVIDMLVARLNVGRSLVELSTAAPAGGAEASGSSGGILLPPSPRPAYRPQRVGEDPPAGLLA